MNPPTDACPLRPGWFQDGSGGPRARAPGARGRRGPGGRRGRRPAGPPGFGPSTHPTPSRWGGPPGFFPESRAIAAPIRFPSPISSPFDSLFKVLSFFPSRTCSPPRPPPNPLRDFWPFGLYSQTTRFGDGAGRGPGAGGLPLPAPFPGVGAPPRGPPRLHPRGPPRFGAPSPVRPLLGNLKFFSPLIYMLKLRGVPPDPAGSEALARAFLGGRGYRAGPRRGHRPEPRASTLRFSRTPGPRGGPKLVWGPRRGPDIAPPPPPDRGVEVFLG